MRHVVSFAIVCMVTSGSAFAQGGAAAPANPLTQGSRGAYEMVKGYITKAAEQVPENLYGFKATPEVRSLGQLFAHVADANYMICGAAAGETAPGGGVEKSQTTKAGISAGLAASFAYCDKVWAATTDASAATPVKMPFGPAMPRLSALSFNTSHDFEHYGNIVTYMRLNKMVPPSSQGQGMR
jgi:uncharacterized damage-inducible protein DinB